MSKYSYSKVSTFKDCPYKYKLRYLDKLETKFDEKATNPLILGTCVHTGIEKRSVSQAVDEYKSSYSIWDNNNEVEIAKLESIIPVAIRDIPEGEYEFKLLVDGFIGFIDLLVKIDDKTFDLYDFKYSNNADNYKKSGQVHVYKYYYEKITGNIIRNMYYALIPKNTNTLYDMSERELLESIEDLKNQSVQFIPIEYDSQQVAFFFANRDAMLNATEFPKKQNRLCYFCEYRKYCQSNGQDTSELKKKKEETEETIEEVSLW